MTVTVYLCSGTVANDIHYQAYLLEGIMRWNEDRAVAATSDGGSDQHTYSDALQAAVNQLSAKVHGHETISGFRPAKLHTGQH